MKKLDKETAWLLACILAALETPEEALAFLEDLCTPKECWMLPQRVNVAKLLMEERSYSKIIKTLSNERRTVSTGTCNAVNTMLAKSNGSLVTMIRRVTEGDGI